jgi:hypothetical protein
LLSPPAPCIHSYLFGRIIQAAFGNFAAPADGVSPSHTPHRASPSRTNERLLMVGVGARGRHLRSLYGGGLFVSTF